MQRYSKFLLLVLLAVSISFAAWILLRGGINLQASATPTISMYADFNVTIPSKAMLKNYLTVSAEATPGVNCTLTFIPASGETQIMETVGNSEGECVWRWKLEESFGRGAARLIFTINGLSDTHYIEILNSF